MFRLYKDLTAWYWVGVALAAIIVGVAAATTLFLLVLLTITVALVFLIAFLFFLEVKANKRIQKLHDDLLDHCRIHEYIAAYEALLQRHVASKKKVRDVLQTNLAIGYNAIGDSQRAIHLTMAQLPINTATRQGQQQILIYCNNMATYLLDAGDQTNAVKALDDLRKELAVADSSIPNYLFCSANLSKLEIRLAVERGQGEPVRKALEIELANEQKQLRRLSLCRLLALIRLQADDTAGAKEYLIYMQQNGGDTYYVSWAAHQLQLIGEKESTH